MLGRLSSLNPHHFRGVACATELGEWKAALPKRAHLWLAHLRLRLDVVSPVRGWALEENDAPPTDDAKESHQGLAVHERHVTSVPGELA